MEIVIPMTSIGTRLHVFLTSQGLLRHCSQSRDCETEAELRFAAFDQAHQGATRLRSTHDAKKKGDENSRRAKQHSKEQANNATARLRDSFFLLDRRASSRSVASPALWRTVRGDFQPQPPSIRLARKKTRTADVAKTFDGDPSMATQ